MKKLTSTLVAFFRHESAGGYLLMAAALAAIVLANSTLAPYYQLLLDVPVEVRIGNLNIAKPLLLWVNDGLMAVFFLLIGLELKREFIEGDLSKPRNIVLPGLGALGGMLVPAAIYVAFNWDNAGALEGWAIPAATDIAFALGILTLLGPRVPASLKVFLASLAIFDDIGAIIIIAIFYTGNISATALYVVAGCLILLVIMNRNHVESKSAYGFIGAIMWVSMLKSGVHATLAGILLAMFIPMRSVSNSSRSPVKELEHDLHSTVAFFIIPVFAFCNAGIALSGISKEQLLHGVPVGIAAGLFVGKQIGVFGLCWLGIKLGMASLPKGMNLLSLYGTACLCGVGFTMSLFIGSLAFEGSGVDYIFDERLGILIGSLASGLAGYFVLRLSFQNEKAT